ncbi:MAG: LemA family protein [Gemmataceae bacterium]
MGTGFIIAIGVAVVLLLFFIGIYNGLVARKNRFKNAYSQIDVQLKRRYDLIPNLVEAVKGYMGHEKQTLEAVIAARNSASSAGVKVAADPGNPEAMNALRAAESSLGGSLGRLFALAEAYPDLKANQNMMQLQEELSSTENKVGFARQAFNDAVMDYNIYRETFPNVVVAGFTGFTVAQQFALDNPTEREAPRVKF